MSLPRYTRLARTPMKRGGRVKARNAAHRNRDWSRAYGSAERVAFVAALPCACGCGRGPCENAHVVKGDGGMGYKASARFIAPLFHECHRLLHTTGPESFAARHALDLAACAEATERAYQQAVAA